MFSCSSDAVYAIIEMQGTDCYCPSLAIHSCFFTESAYKSNHGYLLNKSFEGFDVVVLMIL